METSIQERDLAGIKVVTARLNYLAESTPKPINYAYDPPAGVPRRSGKYLPQSVAVHNGRELLSKFSLDTNGFVLTEHESAVKDFYDSDEVKSVYYPEVERLLKRETGAERVVVFDHIVRNPMLAERGEKGARAPARFVHNDYSFKAAPRRVRDLMREDAETAPETPSLPADAPSPAQESLRRNQCLAADSRPHRKLTAGTLRR
jgi:hypothetical protein